VYADIVVTARQSWLRSTKPTHDMVSDVITHVSHTTSIGLHNEGGRMGEFCLLYLLCMLPFPVPLTSLQPNGVDVIIAMMA
jgi:hypothetical protein